ncbi:hypothetical protein Cpir12675_005053 [Ceratocystis pirilliformis]|uniref:Rhodopsin domain-containing protein n=1 Tax=Ceratocystis pirilliformis TaxID=259994 RepID=A0ABR3YS97_9PEZI
MVFYTSPPPMSTFFEDKPTLLVCWWVTLFSTAIILIRVFGRLVRTEHLFFEDSISFWALVPIYLRMGCVHYVMLYGTNNADFSQTILTEAQLRHKQIASGLVLGARVFFAASLWVLKFSSLEFLKRLIDSTWKRSYTRTIRYARIALAVTFAAVFISIFAECQPFNHYWQVLPDPGGRCRQGYVQMLVTGLCNIFTDLMLVIIPIPIIVRSNMTVKRKAQLIVLFSLNLSVMIISVVRTHNVMLEHGEQQYRSMMASIELLFAVAASNSLVLGSFVRDRGVKKNKFRFDGDCAGLSPGLSDHQSIINSAAPGRHQVYKNHWGSDEDLVQGLGLGLKPELRQQDTITLDPKDQHPHFTPAPILLRPVISNTKKISDKWQMPFHQCSPSCAAEQSVDSPVPRDTNRRHPMYSHANSHNMAMLPRLNTQFASRPCFASSPMSPCPTQAAAIAKAASTPLTSTEQISFFDLGGLLAKGGSSGYNNADEEMNSSSFRRASYVPPIEPLTEAQLQNQSYWAYQSAMLAAPMPTVGLLSPNPGSGKRFTAARLYDLGGLLPPGSPDVISPDNEHSRPPSSEGSSVRTECGSIRAPAHSPPPPPPATITQTAATAPAPESPDVPSFVDVSGLLK